MKASYIIELIKNDEDIIKNISTQQDRINKVIEIIKLAPIPAGTPPQFAFFETMNIESDAIIKALEIYKKSGRVDVIPINDFSNVESSNVRKALKYIYNICEYNNQEHE